MTVLCGFCSQEMRPLGILGDLRWFRCPGCGAEDCCAADEDEDEEDQDGAGRARTNKVDK